MLNGVLIPVPDAGESLKPASTVTLMPRLAVVLIGTLPKSTLAGLAAKTLIPAPWTGRLIGRQLPPATGHSKMVKALLELEIAVGVYDSVTLHVPGPRKLAQGPKEKPNGALIPLPVTIESW